mmetsp:Transcript_89528/g.175223  ORF Transcript_89528/g.175223 Transcript_89528/m.175223 type:complete len:81 (-) Transcript_89528:183-425(-)
MCVCVAPKLSLVTVNSCPPRLVAAAYLRLATCLRQHGKSSYFATHETRFNILYVVPSTLATQIPHRSLTRNFSLHSTQKL